jgi:hypothetical protein
VLDGDLIAEVTGRPGSGVGDQRLVRVEFKCEVVAQEARQLIFDGRGFGLRSDEPQEMIIGVAGVPEPTVPGVLRVARGKPSQLATQVPGFDPVPAPACPCEFVLPPCVFRVRFPAFPSGVLRDQNRLDVDVQLNGLSG